MAYFNMFVIASFYYRFKNKAVYPHGTGKLRGLVPVDIRLYTQLHTIVVLRKGTLERGFRIVGIWQFYLGHKHLGHRFPMSRHRTGNHRIFVHPSVFVHIIQIEIHFRAIGSDSFHISSGRSKHAIHVVFGCQCVRHGKLHHGLLAGILAGSGHLDETSFRYRIATWRMHYAN